MLGYVGVILLQRSSPRYSAWSHFRRGPALLRGHPGGGTLSAVPPPLCTTSVSAPAVRSARAAISCPPCAANIKGDQPCLPRCWSTVNTSEAAGSANRGTGWWRCGPWSPPWRCAGRPRPRWRCSGSPRTAAASGPRGRPPPPRGRGCGTRSRPQSSIKLNTAKRTEAHAKLVSNASLRERTARGAPRRGAARSSCAGPGRAAPPPRGSGT